MHISKSFIKICAEFHNIFLLTERQCLFQELFAKDYCKMLWEQLVLREYVKDDSRLPLHQTLAQSP